MLALTTTGVLLTLHPLKTHKMDIDSSNYKQLLRKCPQHAFLSNKTIV